MMSVPGINPGSTSATMGAASMPIPNPMDPCMQEASMIATATTEYAATLTLSQ